MSAPDGKYDIDAENLLRKYPASQFCLVFIGGDAAGFSIATAHPIFLKSLPNILRHVANHIERTADTADWKITKL